MTGKITVPHAEMNRLVTTFCQPGTNGAAARYKG